MFFGTTVKAKWQGKIADIDLAVRRGDWVRRVDTAGENVLKGVRQIDKVLPGDPFDSTIKTIQHAQKTGQRLSNEGFTKETTLELLKVPVNAAKTIKEGVGSGMDIGKAIKNPVGFAKDAVKSAAAEALTD